MIEKIRRMRKLPLRRVHQRLPDLVHVTQFAAAVVTIMVQLYHW